MLLRALFQQSLTNLIDLLCCLKYEAFLRSNSGQEKPDKVTTTFIVLQPLSLGTSL